MGRRLEESALESTGVALARIKGQLRLSLEGDRATIVPLDRDGLIKSATSLRPILVVITPCGTDASATSLLFLSADRSGRLLGDALETGGERPVAILSFTGQMVLCQIAKLLAESHAERIGLLAGGETRVGAAELVFDGGGDVAAARLAEALPRGALTTVKVSLRVPGEPALLGHHLYVLAGEAGEAPPTELPDGAVELATAPRRLALLVADADDGSCELLRSWLGDAHDLDVVHDGESALRSCLARRPHVAFVAPSLARLSGIAVGWTLRNDARFQGIRIVYLVSAADDAERDGSLWYSVLGNARIRKPLSRDEVLAELGKAEDTSAPAPPSHAKDVRLVPRVTVSLPALLSTRIGQSQVIVRELSPRGALVATSLKLETGAVARLAIDSPHGKFDASCEVLYARSEGSTLLGLGFRALSDESQRLIVWLLGKGAPAPDAGATGGR